MEKKRIELKLKNMGLKLRIELVLGALFYKTISLSFDLEEFIEELNNSKRTIK